MFKIVSVSCSAVKKELISNLWIFNMTAYPCGYGLGFRGSVQSFPCCLREFEIIKSMSISCFSLGKRIPVDGYKSGSGLV